MMMFKLLKELVRLQHIQVSNECKFITTKIMINYHKVQQCDLHKKCGIQI